MFLLYYFFKDTDDFYMKFFSKEKKIVDLRT